MPKTPVPATILADAGRAFLIGTSAPGIYLKSSAFQEVSDALERQFSVLLGAADLGWAGAPVIALADLERSAYSERFPQFVATVTPNLSQGTGNVVETAMTPAACLNLYSSIARRGPVGPAGLMASTTCACHRNEVDYGPTRMQSFHMAELVFFGRRKQVRDFLDRAGKAVHQWLVELGLHPLQRAANDPFFGRGADLMARHQRDLQSKTEVTLPIGMQAEVACFSFNDHAEFFGQRWEISLAEGGWVQSACVGVGLERLTLALIDRHGDRPIDWAQAVRRIVFGEAA